MDNLEPDPLAVLHLDNGVGMSWIIYEIKTKNHKKGIAKEKNRQIRDKERIKKAHRRKELR